MWRRSVANSSSSQVDQRLGASILDRTGAPFRLTEARWQKYTRMRKQ